MLFTDTDSLVYEINQKGINQNIFKNTEHEKYMDDLLNKKVVKHSMKRIQSKLHTIGIYDVFQISFSCFEDKRYILHDGINNFAYFHKDKRSQ